MRATFHCAVAVALLLGTCVPCIAGGAGTTAAGFLLVGQGARAMAMGGASRALVEDATAVYWNPAMLGAIDRTVFVASDRVGYADMNQGYAGLATPLWNGVLGVSATYFDAGGLEGTDDQGDPTGQFDASDLSFDLGYGMTLGSAFYLGFGAGSVLSRIDESDESTFTGSLGAAYDLSPAIRVGAVVQNLGGDLGKDGLPTLVGGGVGWRWGSLALEGDVASPSGEDGYVAVGGEYMIGPLALRAGYSSQADAGDGLHAGLGIQWDRFFLDYAYVPMGDLGADHHISIGMR
jgi:hypothetical protein